MELNRRSERGFTLLEVGISLSIFSVAVWGIYTSMITTSESYTNGTQLAQLQQRCRQVMDELIDELRQADRATITIVNYNGSQKATFVKNTGISGVTPTWSGTITWAYESSIVDANNNGVTGYFADEGSIVRTEVGATTVTLTHNVQYVGFLMVKTGNRITVTIKMHASDARGKLLTTSLTTSVTMSNSST